VFFSSEFNRERVFKDQNPICAFGPPWDVFVSGLGRELNDSIRGKHARIGHNSLSVVTQYVVSKVTAEARRTNKTPLEIFDGLQNDPEYRSMINSVAGLLITKIGGEA
jgi:hypothetical protein